MRREPGQIGRLLLTGAIFVFAFQSAVGQQTNRSAAPVDNSSHKSDLVTVNGIKLHYLDWGGSGQDLLLLNGFTDNAHIFDDFAPKFTDSLHVIGLTRRGFGESDRPATGYVPLLKIYEGFSTP